VNRFLSLDASAKIALLGRIVTPLPENLLSAAELRIFDLAKESSEPSFGTSCHSINNSFPFSD